MIENIMAAQIEGNFQILHFPSKSFIYVKIYKIEIIFWLVASQIHKASRASKKRKSFILKRFVFQKQNNLDLLPKWKNQNMLT